MERIEGPRPSTPPAGVKRKVLEDAELTGSAARSAIPVPAISKKQIRASSAPPAGPTTKKVKTLTAKHFDHQHKPRSR